MTEAQITKPDDHAAAAAPERTDSRPMTTSGRLRYWLGTAVALPAAGLLWHVAIGPVLPTPGGWHFAAGALVALLLLCSVTDLARHKIYNWATYTAFLLALLFNLAVDLYAANGEPSSARQIYQQLGAVGLGSSLMGGLVCFFALLVAYSMSGMRGAGDVKLATATGAWLGPYEGLLAIVFTYIVAGVILLCLLIAWIGPFRLIGHVGRKVGSFLWPAWIHPPAAPLRLLKTPVPMGAFFALGTMLVLFQVLLL
jgi:prepilin peptidase CpaA